MRPPSSRRAMCPGAAFTLVELLVVIAIISVLAAMLLPTLEHALEEARKVECLNRKKQLGLSVVFFATEHRDLMPTRMPSYGLGDFAMERAYTAEFDRNCLVYNWRSVQSPQGVLAVLGYVGGAQLMHCPSFPRNMATVPTATRVRFFYDYPEYHYGWRNLTDGMWGNEGFGFWSCLAARTAVGRPTPLAGTLPNITLTRINREWSTNTYCSPVLFADLNKNVTGTIDIPGVSHRGEGVGAIFCDGSARWIPAAESGGTWHTNMHWAYMRWDFIRGTIAPPR